MSKAERISVPQIQITSEIQEEEKLIRTSNDSKVRLFIIF